MSRDYLDNHHYAAALGRPTGEDNRRQFYPNLSWTRNSATKQESTGNSLLSRIEQPTTSLLHRISPMKIEEHSALRIKKEDEPMEVDWATEGASGSVANLSNNDLADQLIASALAEAEHKSVSEANDGSSTTQSAVSDSVANACAKKEDNSLPSMRNVEVQNGGNRLPESIHAQHNLIAQAKRLLVPVITQNARLRDPEADVEVLQNRVMSLITDDQCLQFLKLAKDVRDQLQPNEGHSSLTQTQMASTMTITRNQASDSRTSDNLEELREKTDSGAAQEDPVHLLTDTRSLLIEDTTQTGMDRQHSSTPPPSMPRVSSKRGSPATAPTEPRAMRRSTRSRSILSEASASSTAAARRTTPTSPRRVRGKTVDRPLDAPTPPSTVTNPPVSNADKGPPVPDVPANVQPDTTHPLDAITVTSGADRVSSTSTQEKQMIGNDEAPSSMPVDPADETATAAHMADISEQAGNVTDSSLASTGNENPSQKALAEPPESGSQAARVSTISAPPHVPDIETILEQSDDSMEVDMVIDEEMDSNDVPTAGDSIVSEGEEMMLQDASCAGVGSAVPPIKSSTSDEASSAIDMLIAPSVSSRTTVTAPPPLVEAASVPPPAENTLIPPPVENTPSPPSVDNPPNLAPVEDTPNPPPVEDTPNPPPVEDTPNLLPADDAPVASITEDNSSVPPAVEASPLALPNVLHAVIGRHTADVIDLTFEVAGELDAALRRWINRRTDPSPSPSYARLFLLCLSAAQIKEVYEQAGSSAEQFANALRDVPTEWPQRGKLMVETNAGQPSHHIFLPQQMGPQDGPLDITPVIQSGTNTIRLIQLGDLSDRLFILFAREPLETDLKWQAFERSNNTTPAPTSSSSSPHTRTTLVPERSEPLRAVGVF
ncbi:hypothetical protein BDW22DRAFT_126613 [Trametopsis cervina]|nr:hypothetical protein BDW22DRAFT_126613 [Trametopsis cervina]